MQGALQALQGTFAEDSCELHLVHLWLLSCGAVDQAAALLKLSIAQGLQLQSDFQLKCISQS